MMVSIICQFKEFKIWVQITVQCQLKENMIVINNGMKIQMFLIRKSKKKNWIFICKIKMGLIYPYQKETFRIKIMVK